MARTGDGNREGDSDSDGVCDGDGDGVGNCLGVIDSDGSGYVAVGDSVSKLVRGFERFD